MEQIKRGYHKTIIGIVKSDKMDKTICVEIQRLVQHPRYKKYIRRYTTVKAHDEKHEAHVGDQVELMETRPISKTKTWRLMKIIRSASMPDEAKA